MTELAKGPGVSQRLKVVHTTVDDLRDQEIDLAGPVTWLGRIEGNDIVLAEPGVSRHHAFIELDDEGKLVLHDNESSNGVTVDGERIEEIELTHGQQFTLGTTTFELISDGEGAGDQAAPTGGTVMISDFREMVALLEQSKDFFDLGESETIPANAPFLLSDSNCMWLVQSGKVEIFTVQVEKGKPVGARDHFISIGEGEVFFGLDADTLGFDSGFLAVAKAGSVVVKYDVERLPMYTPDAGHRELLIKAVGGWVAGLSKRLTSDVSSIPDPELLLRADEEIEVPPDVVTTAGNEIVWFEVPPARLLFDGMASLSYEAEGVFFPLGPGSWLEVLASDEPIKLTVKKTADAIGDPRMWAGLGVFHRVLMECELLNKKLAVVDEFNRLQRKAERADAAREEGRGAIESVLGGATKWEQQSIGATDVDPVYNAMRLVGERMGMKIKKPIGEVDKLSFDETVQVVATASRCRSRRIALIGDWWAHEQGNMLCWRDEDERPIAVVLDRKRKYHWLDPVSGERGMMSEEKAEELASFGYVFYKPLPDGALSAKDLIKFGMSGLGRDMREVGIMGIVAGLLGTATPAITGMVIDNAIPQAERSLLWAMCGALFMVALATSTFKITQNVAMLRLQTKLENTLQSSVWDRLLDLPVTFFQKFSAGDLSDRASAVDKIRSIIAGAGVAAILGSFASFFNAGQMFIYNTTMAAVAIVLTLMYVTVTTSINYAKLRLQREEMYAKGRITGLVLQLINGVGKLRVTGAEDHAFRVWATEFAEMRRISFGVGRIGNLMPIVNAAYPVISSMIIFFTVAKLMQGAAEKGQPFDLSTGDFLAFNAAYGVFLAAMQAMGDASINLAQILPIYERMRPILEEESEVDDSKAAPAKLRGNIDISHVSFRYAEDAPLVLKDVTLSIEPGQFVAFVGGSGSGKSTLMKVMLGFLRAEQGGIYYDGQDLSTLDVRMVRQQLGVVLQESRLLPADIYRNIVGSSSRTVAEAWEAARKAGLAEDLKKLPMGMHTYVSEGGGGFSGGQKQRLMIARALVHNPRILYLDEATSALDNKTQAMVTESMDNLQATRVVIAHRLSTIANADKICYLDKGKLVEMGTYDELMELDGLFAQLARRQLA
jgi:NHLM bacteriocin system ABC transporter ATP-binding protein